MGVGWRERDPEVGVHDLGSIERIPVGEGRRFRVAGAEVAVFRSRDGEVYAVQAACPHRGGPLADGLVGAGRVICPLHGQAFDLATGEPVRPGCAALRTFAVEVSAGGTILLSLEEAAQAG